MSEMVEMVARGIADKTWGEGHYDRDATDREKDEKWRPIARAAIMEMRNPAVAALLAGSGACLDDHALEVWQAMIDEALK